MLDLAARPPQYCGRPLRLPVIYKLLGKLSSWLRRLAVQWAARSYLCGEAVLRDLVEEVIR